jgi:hypothetical protein
MRGFEGRIGLGLGLSLALLWTATGLQARQPAEGMPLECEVTVGLEQIPIQADPVTVPVQYTDELGEAVTAILPEESGVAVTGVGRDETDEANVLRLVLDTSEAIAGEWPVTLLSGDRECRGVARIGSPEAETDGR